MDNVGILNVNGRRNTTIFNEASWSEILWKYDLLQGNVVYLILENTIDCTKILRDELVNSKPLCFIVILLY